MSVMKHGMSVQIISRDPNVWELRCGRHAVWTGPTYEAVEDEWRQHVYAEKGTVLTPCGSKEGRWML